MKFVLKIGLVLLFIPGVMHAQNVYTVTTPTSATAYANVQAAVTAAGTSGSVVIPSSYKSSASITGFSISSNTVIFTAANTFQSGQGVLISGLTTGTYLNGSSLVVLSTGLSSTQFEASFTHANVGTTSDSGLASCCNDRWTNPNNIKIQDLRALNQNGVANFAGAPVPITTIKAADYGALCNGQQDDYAYIQAALNAAVAVEGGYSTVPPGLMGPAVVELPQGHCQLSQPLILMNYGSIQGHGNNTWISAYGAFSNAAYVNIVQGYGMSQPAGAWKRFVRDISFGYGGAFNAVTAVRVYNQIGSSTSYPYPSGSGPGGSQLENAGIGGIEISGLYCYEMDTCIQLDDTNGANVFNNYGYYLRQGIWDNGNNYSLTTMANNFIVGSNTYTSISGGSTGLFAVSDERWLCNGGTGQTCAGGTITKTLTASPQGFSVFDTTIDGYSVSANLGDSLGWIAENTCFCDAQGAYSIYINSVSGGLYMSHNTISTAFSSGQVGMEIVGLTGAPNPGVANSDSWRIDSNVFSSDVAGTSTGLQINSGSYPFRNLYITNNQLANYQNGIVANSGVVNGRIAGNYGNTNTGSLIVFNKADGSTPAFSGTVVDGNTAADNEAVLTDTTGGGYLVGFNRSTTVGSSPGQVLGTLTATGTGCSIAAGSVGTLCGPITVSINNLPASPTSTNYQVLGCALNGASGEAAPTLIAGSKSAFSFTVYLASQTTAASSGGTMLCTVLYQ